MRWVVPSQNRSFNKLTSFSRLPWTPADRWRARCPGVVAGRSMEMACLLLAGVAFSCVAEATIQCNVKENGGRREPYQVRFSEAAVGRRRCDGGVTRLPFPGVS